MQKLRAHSLAISLDGYMAGPSQGLDHPLGVGGERLHDWAFATRTFRKVHGMDGGDEGVDDEWASRGDVGIGATIMGRNMFGPIRGPWGDDEWRGWWGEDPPFHHPVFVLTHHARDPLAMEGGTTFHFVTDGIETALERATEAAGGLHVRLGGGAATIGEFLRPAWSTSCTWRSSPSCSEVESGSSRMHRPAWRTCTSAWSTPDRRR
jgi:dihydrofolate reductase